MALRTILLLSFFCLSMPVCLVRPFYGILLWTIVAFLNPQAYIWDTTNSFPWALSVAIPTLAGFFLFSRGWLSRLQSREFYLIVALWTWFTITSLVSTNTAVFFHHSADTWYRWAFVSKILLMTVVTMGIVDSFARLRTLVLVIAGCFGVFILKSIPFMLMTGGEYRLYGPPNSMIADNNDFGLALNMTVPLYFFLAQTESRRWLKWLFGFLFVVTIPAIFFTYSRGALIGLVAILGLMLLQLKRRLLLVPVIALGAIIALLFAPEAWKERMDPSSSSTLDASARSRLNAWTFSWRLASDYPLAGGGFETFTPELFNRYAPNPADVHGPHSVYFGVLGEHGFFGLLLYLSLVASCMATLRRMLKMARSRGDQIVVSYANMFRFSLVGFLVSGMFLGRAYFDYFFAVVACAAVLKRVCLSDWASADAADGQAKEQAA